MTQKDFEKLSKKEQDFRWALFIESNGHQKNISKKLINELKNDEALVQMIINRNTISL